MKRAAIISALCALITGIAIMAGCDGCAEYFHPEGESSYEVIGE